jgi:hypothetical protein
MHMASYQATLVKLQPIIELVCQALSKGLDIANSDHADHGYDRGDDQHHFAGLARRHVMQTLRDAGLLALKPDSDRPEHAMSALRANYEGVALWMFKRPHPFGDQIGPAGASRHGYHEVPLPGRSAIKQQFWRQESALPGMETDNILWLWSEYHGVLCTTMTLVRPVAGDHRRDSLVCQWVGYLTRDMATLSVEDLNELEPVFHQPMLGMDGA